MPFVDVWILFGLFLAVCGLTLGWALGRMEDLERELEEERRNRRWTR